MIQLEAFTADDFVQLKEWINTEALMTNWSGSLFRFPLTDDRLNWYIDQTNELGISDAYVFKAVDKGSNATIGHISLGSISWKNRSARISRVLIAPEAQGKSFCQKMVKAVLKIGFEDLKLHRIGLGVYTHNQSAIKCYEKAGLNIEGIQRDVMFYENEFWSMAEMAILEDEWLALQQSSSIAK